MENLKKTNSIGSGKLNVSNLKKLKVALVDDFLTVDGGAQKVLRAMHEIWPDAPVYTTTYFPDKFHPKLEGWDIRQSFVSKFPFRETFENQYKLFYQLAMEQFKFDGYDLVISSTYAGYAKGIIVPESTLHLSYIHTVPRYLWKLPTQRHEKLNPIYKNIILPPLEHFWRIWDRQTADRPDYLISNSNLVQSRVKKFYRRDSFVIYPPVEVDDLAKVSNSKEDYFVYFGRLESYKKVHWAIKACIRARSKLKIIGDGTYLSELESLVTKMKGQKYVQFLGRTSDKVRNDVVSKAKAFIFPCPTEDFGIVPVESMALGTPVIAFKSGGVMETVENGKTGILTSDISVNGLVEAIEKFDADKFRPEICRKVALSFSKESFTNCLLNFVGSVYGK
ncbi:glycosyltransferase [Candidatus Dojkabacteria bacterium]|nr:glycosyltransferase [Candidatus Dojkabacteria bacterium]